MDIYRALQKHLDVMPVAFPETDTGIEIDILRRFFSEEEATVALGLNMLPETVERIHRRVGKHRMSLERVKEILDDLDEKKVVNTKSVRRRGREVRKYGKLPFVVGLYEFQEGRLTREFEEEASVYLDDAFMRDFINESPRQMRTIPINETILPGRNVSRYDSIRQVILESPGPFAAHPCICRQGRELVGQQCTRTDRLETCLALGTAAEGVLAEGRGHELSREETLEFLKEAEAEGLVLQSQNTRHPVYICCCCSCCCGILSRIKKLPDPGTLLKSNFYASVDSEACIGCGKCLPRCPMTAISLSGRGRQRTASVNPERCIGCGLCVSACPVGAISMRSKGPAVEPPRSAMLMYIRMFIGRFGPIKGVFLLLKAGLGFRV